MKGKRVEAKCANDSCNVILKLTESEIRNNKRYCCRKCMNADTNFLKERGRKISKTITSKIENGTHTSPFKGKHVNENAKKKQSHIMKKKYISGEIKPWNKGKTKYTDQTLFDASINMSKNWLSEKRKKYLKSYLGSKLEEQFKSILLKHNINFEEKVWISRKQFDFLIVDKKILVETHGDYWHCNPDIYEKPIHEVQNRNMKNDQIKEDIALKHKFKLIVVWESDVKKNTDRLNNIIQELVC